jgi:uncharacterized membrane protein YdjX (TVP38/TMEM64 family)
MPFFRTLPSLLILKLLILSYVLGLTRAFSMHKFKLPYVGEQTHLSLRKVSLRRNQLQTPRRKTDLSFFWQTEETAISEDSSVESSRKHKNPFLRDQKGNEIEKSSKSEKHLDRAVKYLGKEKGEVDVVEETTDGQAEQPLGGFVAIGAVVAAGAAAYTYGTVDTTEISLKFQSLLEDPTASLEVVVDTVQSMGPLGYLYFGGAYTLAEILAIPAIPLTASAGYLFGVRDGTAVVLVSATVAAGVSFIIGRTFLRSYVEKLLESYPDFKKIDKAIGEEGFKLMLLLRLSPIFPFALSNYLYGVTSIKFWPYLFGTMLGFTPGTIAYVFTGEIGKSLTLDAATAEPWYVYAGALALLSGFIKIVSDVSTGIIEKVQDDDDSVDDSFN